jgi:hypothetical protein
MSDSKDAAVSPVKAQLEAERSAWDIVAKEPTGIQKCSAAIEMDVSRLPSKKDVHDAIMFELTRRDRFNGGVVLRSVNWTPNGIYPQIQFSTLTHTVKVSSQDAVELQRKQVTQNLKQVIEHICDTADELEADLTGDIVVTAAHDVPHKILFYSIKVTFAHRICQKDEDDTPKSRNPYRIYGDD